MKHDGDPPHHPPAAPSGAATVFGDRLGLAERFVAELADTGVGHGLIGPREVPRLWARHVLNCAVIQDAFPVGSTLIDVGSGAGLPGIAVALARPDLTVHLVEPMQRRTTWLEAVIDRLALEGVAVHRGRAEELAGTLEARWVTARAVARIDKLARWCVPLLAPGGTLVAMKGQSAAVELSDARPALETLGLSASRVSGHGQEVLDEPVLTVDLTFGARAAASARRRPARSTSARGRGRQRRASDGQGQGDASGTGSPA